MARDLAIDYNTGDLLIAPNRDLDLRTGQAVIEQRIRIRLRVWAGEWDINPSLGSRLHDVLRMPNQRALQTAELVVREALEPMTDIYIQDVQVSQDTIDARKLNVTIIYAMLELDGQPGESFETTTTIGVSE